MTRERLETWIAALHPQVPDPTTRSHQISSISTLLKDIHRHEWLPELPGSAFLYHDDGPRPRVSKPRFIPEPLMRQLERPEALAKFPSDDGRLLLELLIACGLRIKDARWLPFDCIVRDASGNPYLAWLNRKIHNRPAFFPLSTALADRIAVQQGAVHRRFPNGTPWLFPATNANLDGSKPVSDRRLRDQLKAWLDTLDLRDEHGRPVKITFHQFRHTLATRLINANVPQHVVQQLLDHMSPQMTAVYARLLDKTVRQHWERATKVNADGQPVQLDPEHPLADAAWMKLSMVRAKVTLPNGYCGAPIQTDCEYANPCLDCRFFITTTDFLAQHRRQHEETERLIADATASGLARVAEKNTRTLRKLDQIIDALEQTTDGQIVAGER
ncbi:tyrosine-type recombinase/integrase [Nonomuraea sp. NEAU-A123]|uniref:tyrosine-type recombinase/integrase n=1 Tax=Nonomuraea sp. NEAU-A123 TaxID=2839649 RepID=UPI001BE404DA|nr:tyrosine-type recombinase/integrase [Nonomuraea sp. NEAU-A123]MBT2225064.1 site-specific integrase [Nonomuraea sp. NEAU-A123]